MSISDRLNEAMQGGGGREKVTQSELSRRTRAQRHPGVPQPTIARILKGDGKKGPETDTLIRLANALGVEFMWLQQGVEPKYAGDQATNSKGSVVEVQGRAQVFKRHWLSEDEADHLADYRSLTEQNRKRLRFVVSGMARDDVDLGRADDL